MKNIYLIHTKNDDNNNNKYNYNKIILIYLRKIIFNKMMFNLQLKYTL